MVYRRDWCWWYLAGFIILQRETGSALVYLAFFFMLYREGMPGSILFVGVGTGDGVGLGVGVGFGVGVGLGDGVGAAVGAADAVAIAVGFGDGVDVGAVFM